MEISRNIALQWRVARRQRTVVVALTTCYGSRLRQKKPQAPSQKKATATTILQIAVIDGRTKVAGDNWIKTLGQVEMIMNHGCTDLQISRARLAKLQS